MCFSHVAEHSRFTAAVTETTDQRQKLLMVAEAAADISGTCAGIPEVPEGVPFAVPVTQFPCDFQTGFMAFD